MLGKHHFIQKLPQVFTWKRNSDREYWWVLLVFFFLLLLLVKHINFRDSVFIVCLECPWCTTIKKFKSSKDGIYYRLTKVVCSPVLFTCFLPFWLWNRMTVSKISKLWLTDHRWVNADTDSNSIQWVTIHSQHNNLSLRYRKEKKLVPTVS